MEIISFEKRTFEEIAAKLDYFVQRVESLCSEHGGKETGEWMDNHEVCRRLRISPRTLQTLRDNGTLAFTKIGNRTYYRPDDVERVVGNVEDKRKEARWKGKTICKDVPLEFRQAAGPARKVVGKTATACLWR